MSDERLIQEKENSFTVAGIGPGESSYRLPAVDQAVSEADLLIGGERHLSFFRHLGKEEISLTGQISSLPALVRKRRLSQRVVILVSGDPGYHSLLGLISRNFSPSEYCVIPGISSFQLAAARTGKPWQNDFLLSLHGCVPDEWTLSVYGALEAQRRVFILTDRVHTPRWIAWQLVSLTEIQWVSSCEASLFYRLGHEDEEEESIRLSELAAKPQNKVNKENLCIMIICPPSV